VTRLEKLVRQVHIVGMAAPLGASPVLVVATIKRDHDHLDVVPIPDEAWLLADPADVIDALRIGKGQPPMSDVLGLLFTAEAWLVEMAGKSKAEVDRLTKRAGRHELYLEPDRISIRTTVGLGPDDEFHQLVQRHDETGYTDVVAEGVGKGDESRDFVVQRLLTAAIPAALRNLMGRIEASMAEADG
jgi:hypothetical protein